MGGYMGLGLGVVAHGVNYTAEWGMSFNAGLALTVLEKNRIEFGFKILNNFPFCNLILQKRLGGELWQTLGINMCSKKIRNLILCFGFMLGLHAEIKIRLKEI